MVIIHMHVYSNRHIFTHDTYFLFEREILPLRQQKGQATEATSTTVRAPLVPGVSF